MLTHQKQDNLAVLQGIAEPEASPLSIILSLHVLHVAHLAVLSSELDSLQKAQSLIDAASNGQVVNGGLLKHALRVDDEQAT